MKDLSGENVGKESIFSSKNNIFKIGQRLYLVGIFRMQKSGGSVYGEWLMII